MPTYSFLCEDCGAEEDEIVSFESREAPCKCRNCGGKSYYQFPVEALRGYLPWEGDYYDEALDGDVTGRLDKKRFLKANGLVEAGDKVRGGRNFDRHAPDHIKPRKPRGVSIWENKAKNDREVSKLEKRREAIGE